MSRLNVANFRHPDGTADNITFDSSTNVTANGNLLFAATSNTADQSIQFGDPDATNRGFFNYRHSEDQLQIGTSGTTKVAVNSDGGFAFNSGYGSVGVAYGVRAWIHFDGNAATIGNGDARGNVSSVTDSGTGDYYLNFTNNMPDVNYAVCGSCSGDTPTDLHLYTGHIGVVHNGFSSSGCQIVVTRNQSGAEADTAWNADQVCVAIVR